MGATGPKLDDYLGQASDRAQKAEICRETAARLRELGNEEHAQDYDLMAESYEQRRDEFLALAEAA